MSQQITKSSELTKLLGEHKLVVIDIGADFCAPCRQYSPIFEDVAHEMKDVKFIKIDWANKETQKDFNKFFGGSSNDEAIVSLPTTVLYQNKKLNKVELGKMNKIQLREFIST